MASSTGTLSVSPFPGLPVGPTPFALPCLPPRSLQCLFRPPSAQHPLPPGLATKYIHCRRKQCYTGRQNLHADMLASRLPDSQLLLLDPSSALPCPSASQRKANGKWDWDSTVITLMQSTAQLFHGDDSPRQALKAPTTTFGVPTAAAAAASFSITK